VYPLARGSGPALATVLAVAVLGERPGAVGLVGARRLVGAAGMRAGVVLLALA